MTVMKLPRGFRKAGEGLNIGVEAEQMIEEGNTGSDCRTCGSNPPN